MRYWRIAALFCLGLLSAACGDEESPTEFNEAGNLHGTWVLEEEEGVTYVRITSTAIRVYEEADTCFRRRDYTIEAVDGTQFTVVGTTESGDWQLSVEGNTLVMNNGVETIQLAASEVNVETLQLCAAVVLFGNLHPSCEELPEVPIPGTATGTLEPTDFEWDGTWYDVYSLQVPSATSVTISMTSVPDGDLDTYLAVYNYTGATRIIRNDDIDYDGGNYNSQLTVDLGPGCYVIVANSYDGDDAGEDGGDYVIEVQADLPPQPEFPTPACTALPQLALDASVMGRLEDADPHWSDGTYYDLYGMQVATAGEITIEHRSGADDVVDPYLLLYNADATERIDDNDDIDYDGGIYDSRVVATLDPGCYIVVAGSWSETPDDAGTYMVSATTGTVTPELAHEPCVDLPMIAPGDVVNGTLAAGDSLWDGTWIDLYSLQITESTGLRLTMMEDGSGIDTWLGIYDFQSGTRIIRNDDIDFDGGNYNSQVETTLAPGCYVVFANSYEGDDAGEVGGAYELTAEAI
ncbi:MAG TPA: DVUA0089 family protein [Longimicrobiales bacterium]